MQNIALKKKYNGKKSFAMNNNNNFHLKSIRRSWRGLDWLGLAWLGFAPFEEYESIANKRKIYVGAKINRYR